KQIALTDEQRNELLPSGKQAIFDNRVGWARTYLKKAGLLEQPRRAVMLITSRGRDVLRNNVEHIDCEYLNRFPEFLSWRSGTGTESPIIPLAQISEGLTPEEVLENAYLIIRKSLASDLLSKVKACSPGFFERLVVELLVKIGYGGSLRDAGKTMGRTGDGGIDGIIKEDRLGLDIIYIQAKRWEGTVGRPEIQKFAGALLMHRAKKGVFITTSGFTKEALDYIEKIDSKIVLIDGEQLAQLMMDFDLGVSREAIFELKRIDSDYFLDE
ncbi:MAG: restriction endonuclease, partial [bacterium]|nr:restriction endonuclease [bacterium]